MMKIMMMRGMDDFFPNGISHQIQKEKTIWMMMMKMMKGMDDFFFPNGISHQIQKEKTIWMMMMKMMRGIDDFFSKWDFTPNPKRKKPYR